MAMSVTDKATAWPSIALHALILESDRIGADQIEPVIQDCYPGSVLTITDQVDDVRAKFASTPFDLVVLAIEPFTEAHPGLLDQLRRLEMAMPTVLIVGADEEHRIHESFPELCSTWELVSRQNLTPLVLERRIRKAIDNHQQRWELTHLQHAFRSSLVQYRNLFDEVPDLIFLCDRSGCLLDVNAAAARLLDTSKEDLLMQPIFEKFGISREDFDRLLCSASTDHGLIEDLEIEFRPPGREPVYGLIHLIRWDQGIGRPVQFQGVVKDISPHKRLEQRLRRSEDRYKTLYDMARISSSSLRLDEVVKRSLARIHDCCAARGTLLLINDCYEELNLLEAIEFPEEHFQRLHEAPPVRLGKGLIGTLCIKGGVHRIENPAAELEHPVLRSWALAFPDCQMVAAVLGRGNPTLPASILLMLIDAEAARHRDNELFAGLSKTLEMGMTNCFHYANSQEAEARYRELWDHAPAFFISMLKGGAIIEINKTAVEALGYQPQELIGKPFKILVKDDEYENYEEHHNSLMAAGLPQDYELCLRRRNGEPMIVSIKSDPLYDRHGQRIGEKSVLYDITRDKMMEARLRDYAENLERMVEERTIELNQTMTFLNSILEGSTEYAIVALDQKGTFLHFNRGAQLLFDHDPLQLVGQRRFDVLLNFENTPWASLEAMLAHVDEKGVVVEEIPMVSYDQRQMIALLTVNRLKVTTPNNLTYVAIIRDITEQKEMEDLLKLYTENLQQVIEEKSRELDAQHIQLIQSSKLATLGEMATGIAHELNQPLSGIRTRAQLVTKAIERGIVKRERIEQNQEEIIQLVDRISTIINHMRIFARQDQQKFSPFRLTQSIHGALNLIGEQLRIHAIEVKTEYPAEVPLVLGEPSQIEQVVLNLIANARDALDARGEHERHRANEYHKCLTLRLTMPTPQEIGLEIHDNGMGMSDETRGKVFEPFFTTKPVGRGTGLGLSISYGILTNHNGRLEVESAEGEGTCFRMILPVWDGSEEVAEVARPNDLPL
jgi:PAS domain S-box-containing protein